MGSLPPGEPPLARPNPDGHSRQTNCRAQPENGRVVFGETRGEEQQHPTDWVCVQPGTRAQGEVALLLIDVERVRAQRSDLLLPRLLAGSHTDLISAPQRPDIRGRGAIRNQHTRHDLEPLAAAQVDEIVRVLLHHIQRSIALDALIVTLRAGSGGFRNRTLTLQRLWDPANSVRFP